MHNVDRAVLRISCGSGLAALVCYASALPMPHLGCIMAWIVLCQGKPLALKKGLVMGSLLIVTMTAGILMVPLLTYYALPGVLLTALLLYQLMLMGLYGKTTLSMLLVVAIAVIPIAGLIEQALAIGLAQMLGIGFITGTLVNGLAVALFPPSAGQAPPPRESPAVSAPHLRALRAVIIVLPVWLLALSHPTFYIPAVMKTVTLAQQATTLTTKTSGKELVLSTLLGALLALGLWFGLSLWPSLLMLVLWLSLASLWVARRLVRLVAGRFPPSFWSNVWITALILFGPAIQDSDSAKDVWTAAAMRCTLYLIIALYGWACIALLERWRPLDSSSTELHSGD
ncbi:TPA: DUF2955 domain-containing protein [Raoultella ornithinolytica]|uniref:DUF2955 domain-containing protein n=1 Tax=Raoultella ornithinolytica TaxID=54291 RepID=A0ABZ2DSK1_RAOOR|nr:DUF2955 domain-containing protein [Raoultella ornithinolytica]EHT13155.1 hypothetical protein HMPREF9690_00805 [Raoultella ornithinolytica 10-5246]EKU2864174.1 DUF2955 domain-containing protein [Raoultella ornithinolytica]EKU2865347.1 DUF2955 domain-containing protein [Raoultella ornithinolytica]EKU8630675.1 DUF2955 domain-containing protein [Raoultella ornithinolytica]EKU8635381.1 DUF2955 domain-containing protein [Raoultella ornithinolytica]